ncbi:von Willebrand factor A domain-containing protein DDB_G0267758-like [Rhizophagus clarus]|uniref:von Willebrand factor A domain-containing protein DDB_G0267758-like n=1 Tax=Rhizophagus clarus TaxID=94130 RepID=A0A8H3QAX2_9GLOM|nr:von Willebrand factor A domain-containing protein DDB_G0267758-like [Rhizophagus clarus]
MKSNDGGTEIYSALEWVFENSRDDMPTSVFLITDGAVRNVEQIVRLVSKNEEKKKDDLRFFSHNLVESFARAGKGYVTNDERMDKKVIGMLKNALKPPIKDYNITWTDVNFLEEKKFDETSIEVEKPTISFMSNDNVEPPPPPPIDIFTDTKVQPAPYIIPPIYPGVRFIVYCILKKNIEPCKVITLKAVSQDGPMKLDIPLDPVTLQGSKIHRLAARKLIQDLDDEKSFIHKHPKNTKKHIPASLVKEHIVKLGKTFNLASKYTSFIAIDERNNETVSETQTIPQKREIPQFLNMSAGITDFIGASYGSHSRFSRRVDESDGTERRKEELLKKRQKLEELRRSRELPRSKSKISSNSSEVLAINLLSQKSSNIQSFQKKDNINHKETKIENLFEFLGLQSFNGKFLPNKSFYEFFYKNDLNDFITLKQEIEKELSNLSEKEIEEILSNCVAMAYLKIIMFDNFKDECEMCYEKAEKALKKMIGIKEKENIIITKAEECVKNWVNNNS